MSKTILYIHGCFVGPKYSIFRQSQVDNGGLYGLLEEIKSEKIGYYCWAVDRKTYTFWQSCNPFCYLNTYLLENKYILSNQAQEDLNQTLSTQNPEIILTHSAGNRLLFETLNRFGVNSKLKKIITLASDLPADYKITNQEFISKLSSNVVWENYYCFYDQALLSSSILNLTPRAGLFGSRSFFAKNIFYPLKLSTNFHTSILHDTKFLKKILTI